MEHFTLYERDVSPGGRVRYSPASEYVALDSLSEGTWVITVKPGSTAICQAVTPDYPAVAAALEKAREAMLDAIQEASRFVPARSELSKVEKEALAAYAQVIRKHGLEPYPVTLTRESAWGIVDAALQAMKNEIKG